MCHFILFHRPVSSVPGVLNKTSEAIGLESDDDSSIEDILAAATAQSPGGTLNEKDAASATALSRCATLNEKDIAAATAQSPGGTLNEKDAAAATAPSPVATLNEKDEKKEKAAEETENNSWHVPKHSLKPDQSQKAKVPNPESGKNVTKEETIAKVHAFQDSMRLLQNLLTPKSPKVAHNTSQVDKIDELENPTISVVGKVMESSHVESPAIYKKHLKELSFQKRLQLLQSSQKESTCQGVSADAISENKSIPCPTQSEIQDPVTNTQLKNQSAATTVEELQKEENSQLPSTVSPKCSEKIAPSVNPKKIPPPTKPKPRIRTYSNPLPETGSTSPGAMPPPTPPRSADSIGKRHFWLPQPEPEKTVTSNVLHPAARRKGTKIFQFAWSFYCTYCAEWSEWGRKVSAL